MATAGTPFPTSNNAPLPIPGGYGNPTGANFGGFGSTAGQPFPTMPAYGGPAYNAPTFNAGNMGSLNSGLGFQWGKGHGSDIYNRLGTAYGKGPGELLANILSGGLYNPQVAAAFLNAQQPGIARGQANIEGAFGDAGARFSSAAAIGLGDYNSQVQLNQQQMLAQLYENAQQQELSLLQNVLPTLHQERADEGSWIGKALGGLEAVGGVIAAPFTGGASLALTMDGIRRAAGGNSQAGGGGMMMPGMTGLPGFGGNTGTFGANAPSFGGNPMNIGLPTTSGGMPIDPYMQPNIEQTLQMSGGDLFGGAAPTLPGMTSGGDSADWWQSFMQ